MSSAASATQEECCSQDEPRPEPCDETLVINELIREYLVFNGLRDTLSVFIPGDKLDQQLLQNCNYCQGTQLCWRSLGRWSCC